MANAGRHWQGPAHCFDIGSEVVGTWAVLEGQQEIESGMGRSSRQGKVRLNRTSVLLIEHRTRRGVALSGQIGGLPPDPEGSGPVALVVGVAAADIAERAPVNHRMWISVLDSIHWPCSYPLFVSVRNQRLGLPSVEVVVAWQKTWFGCGRSASSAAGQRRRSLSEIGRDPGRRQRCWSRRYLAEDTGRSPVVGAWEVFGLVDSLPWLLRGRCRGGRGVTVGVSY